MKTEILKVAANSNPGKVAGAISNVIKGNNQAELRAVGAGAVNQAVKAIAIARGYIAPSGVDLACTPAFIDIGEITAMRFIIEPHNKAS